MNTRYAFIAASVLALGGCAHNAGEHQHDSAGQAAAKPAHDMHAHMQKMREQMARIRAETDPKEKERLMQEHMQAMEKSMSMMQDMMKRKGAGHDKP